MSIFSRGTLWLYGTVGHIIEGLDGFTALEVRDALAKAGSGPVLVRINSGGGWASEGVAIYNLLAEHSGKVTVQVDAVAASAASVIAMAGAEIVMATGSEIMIHDPSVATIGTEQDHRKSLEALRVTADAMADIYAKRTGRSKAAVRSEMTAETWMTAKEAIAKRYADRVATDKATNPTAFDYSSYQHTPDRIAAFSTAKRPEASAGYWEIEWMQMQARQRRKSWDAAVAAVNARLGVPEPTK